MKLISTTDFVLELAPKYKTNTKDDDQFCFYKIIQYSNFLKQPLKLEMFAGATELFEGNSEIENGFGCWIITKGTSKFYINNKDTIEDLIKHNLTLTDSAKKQIGL